jgi:hypothetical protein
MCVNLGTLSEESQLAEEERGEANVGKCQTGRAREIRKGTSESRQNKEKLRNAEK